MKVSLDFIDQNECNDSYSLNTASHKLAIGIDPRSQICAGKMEGGKDTCQVRKYFIISAKIVLINSTNPIAFKLYKF